MDEGFLTTEEVLDYLQVNLRTVYRLIKAGKIPAVRVGRQWRFRKRDIDAWLESQRPRATRGAATTPARPTAPAASAGRPRVLVVDDEAPLAEFMRELLGGWGIEATAITNPRKALQAFRADAHAYDLVITDLAMPGSTGFGLARELLAVRPGLPVILYTGHIDPIAERELESAGIRALLPKPVEPDQLHGLLARLLP